MSRELFQLWAPPARVWSQWAKPVLFSCLKPPSQEEAQLNVPQIQFENDRATALIIELPRASAVEYGLAAARAGYWPVPLFNCASGPSAVLNVKPILDRLAPAAQYLGSLRIPMDAPPAFLMDSNRMLPDLMLRPGNFDNRYLLFPQDFPSGGFLRHHGINRVLLLSDMSEPREDLAHVLLRWEKAGLPILRVMEEGAREPMLIRIKTPSLFRSLFYRALAVAGLKRNSAGGFGGIIPQPSSGG